MDFLKGQFPNQKTNKHNSHQLQLAWMANVQGCWESSIWRKPSLALSGLKHSFPKDSYYYLLNLYAALHLKITKLLPFSTAPVK